jgi:hypothetical protein
MTAGPVPFSFSVKVPKSSTWSRRPILPMRTGRSDRSTPERDAHSRQASSTEQRLHSAVDGEFYQIQRDAICPWVTGLGGADRATAGWQSGPCISAIVTWR